MNDLGKLLENIIIMLTHPLNESKFETVSVVQIAILDSKKNRSCHELTITAAEFID